MTVSSLISTIIITTIADSSKRPSNLRPGGCAPPPRARPPAPRARTRRRLVLGLRPHRRERSPMDRDGEPGADRAAAIAARCGSRWPGGSRGPQPVTGSSGASTRARARSCPRRGRCRRRSRSSAFPRSRIRAPATSGQAAGPKASCSAGTARTTTVPKVSSPASSSITPLKPRRRSNPAAPRGSTTGSDRPIRASVRRRGGPSARARPAWRPGPGAPRALPRAGAGSVTRRLSTGRSGAARRRARRARCCARARSAGHRSRRREAAPRSVLSTSHGASASMPRSRTTPRWRTAPFASASRFAIARLAPQPSAAAYRSSRSRSAKRARASGPARRCRDRRGRADAVLRRPPAVLGDALHLVRRSRSPPSKRSERCTTRHWQTAARAPASATSVCVSAIRNSSVPCVAFRRRSHQRKEGSGIRPLRRPHATKSVSCSQEANEAASRCASRRGRRAASTRGRCPRRTGWASSPRAPRARAGTSGRRCRRQAHDRARPGRRGRGARSACRGWRIPGELPRDLPVARQVGDARALVAGGGCTGGGEAQLAAERGNRGGAHGARGRGPRRPRPRTVGLRARAGRRAGRASPGTWPSSSRSARSIPSTGTSRSGSSRTSSSSSPSVGSESSSKRS